MAEVVKTGMATSGVQKWPELEKAEVTPRK
jgi:hypothetical protein